MLAYLIRKALLTLSIIIGVMFLTFLLFNVAASDPVRAAGGKEMKEADRVRITESLGLNNPKFAPNFKKYHGTGNKLDLFQTQFLRIMFFQFPQSQRHQESVWALFLRKAPVSLSIQGPAFVLGLGLQLAAAIYVASKKNTLTDYVSTGTAVLMMSVPSLSIYLGCQWFFCGYLRWFPVAGWASTFFMAANYAVLPIVISVLGSLGGSVRFYRTVALEEINADYVRTARAKGVSNEKVLLVHVFRNLLIPVVTQTVVAIPALVTGSLLLESIFQIPGCGGLLTEAIQTADSPVVMAEIYLITISYAVALFLTDICYTLVDPRVTLR